MWYSILLLNPCFLNYAQVLFSCEGYAWLDVRSELEVSEVGSVKGSINVPFEHVNRVYDAAEGKKVVKRSPNTDFARMVRTDIPCAVVTGHSSRQRSISVLAHESYMSSASPGTDTFC